MKLLQGFSFHKLLTYDFKYEDISVPLFGPKEEFVALPTDPVEKRIYNLNAPFIK